MPVKAIAPFLLAALVSMPALAGVTVTQNVSAGATNWPGTPILQTVTNPAAETSVGESFNSVGGCTNYSETFTIAGTNYTLLALSIYSGGGSGTASGTNLTLYLFDLGSQIAPNPSPYSAGTDLFNAGDGLAILYSPQPTGVLQFNFTGSDQLTLTNGHLYAFEIDGISNTEPLLWQRTTNDSYGGGAAYRNRSWINGNNARDFSLALYATALVNTNQSSPWVPDGIVFYAFTPPSFGVNQDGANPSAGLALSGGVLLGTTLNGGSGGAGTAFSMSLDSTNFSTIHSFASASDAGHPQGTLALSGNGLFGTSLAGGKNGVGTVFLANTNGNVSVVQSFAVVSADEGTNSGGASPNALLALSGNTIYGTTTAGGAAANGTVFSVSTNGSAFVLLHQFTALDSNTGTNPDGALPCGGLILSGNTLYGTASAGGAGGAGIVFSVRTDGSNFANLYSFSALDPETATNTDGALPSSGLVCSNGVLYGVTLTGGAGGKGVIFSVGTNGLGFAVLHSFSAADPLTGTNGDGASPCAALAIVGGNLYGTTSAGGAGADGTVFSVGAGGTPFQTLHTFSAVDSISGTNFDGAFPVAAVLPLGNSLFGTTFGGGLGAVGTVFNIAIPSPPALITRIVQNLDGSFTLYFLGVPNSTNVIQAITSLNTPLPWQIVATNVADGGGVWQFTDTNATSGMRFYRSCAP